MGWRTIYIENASKLSLNLDNLQVLHNREKYSINLDEINNIIIEDYKCVITARLLSKLCELGIEVIFTEMNRMPIGSLHSFSGNSRTAKYSKIQLGMKQVLKQKIWKEIVEQKIKMQALVLNINGIKDDYVLQYSKEVLLGDLNNKEGQAARIYFKKLFGSQFVRFDENIINYSLNYAYQLVRSKISQEIVGRGFNPAFGIFHKSEYNYYNFSDDLIEVYRPIIDNYIFKLITKTDVKYLTPEFKEKILEISNYKVKINNKKMRLKDSIKTYINDINDRIIGKIKKIEKFPLIIE